MGFQMNLDTFQMDCGALISIEGCLKDAWESFSFKNPGSKLKPFQSFSICRCNLCRNLDRNCLFYEHILPFIVLMLHVYQKLDSNILDMTTIYKFQFTTASGQIMLLLLKQGGACLYYNISFHLKRKIFDTCSDASTLK